MLSGVFCRFTDCFTAKFIIECMTGCGAYGSVNQSVARHPFIAVYYFSSPSGLKRGEFVLEILDWYICIILIQ